MSQSLNNQYQAYTANMSVKSGTPAINGQSGAAQHYQNGMQTEHYNSAGNNFSKTKIITEEREKNFFAEYNIYCNFFC